MAIKSGYKLSTGIYKTVKNTFIVMGVPFLIFLADHWTEYIPQNKYTYAAFGLVSYFVKNLIENK